MRVLVDLEKDRSDDTAIGTPDEPQQGWNTRLAGLSRISYEMRRPNRSVTSGQSCSRTTSSHRLPLVGGSAPDSAACVVRNSSHGRQRPLPYAASRRLLLSRVCLQWLQNTL
jgi:hypothetical protein